MSCQLTETEATFPYRSDQFHGLKILSTTDIPILSTTISSQSNLLLLTKQKSWEWEVLFLLLVLVENYTSAGWNTVYYHTGWSSTSPAVCNFTGWWAQRDSPPHTCLAVLSLWPGGCWLSPGCGRDHLGWDKEQWSCLARFSGENASKHSWGWVKSVLSKGQRAVSCPFRAGRMFSESIALKLETSGERFKKEYFFP